MYVYFGGTTTASGSTGTLEGSFTPASNTAWNPYSVTFNVAIPGTYQLMFQGVSSSSNYINVFTDVTEGLSTNALLPAGTALTVAAGATFDLHGASQQVASLSNIASGNGGTITDSALDNAVTLTLAPTAGSTTFSGTIQNGNGTVLLTMNGAPGTTQILTGVNTYTGATTIKGGTLQLGDGATNNGSVGGTIVDTAALVIANPNAQTFANVVSGAGGTLALNGPGTLTVTGANTFTGGTTLTAGTLVLGLGSTGSPGSVTNGPVAPAASFSGTPASVPEPSALLLAVLAGIGLAVAGRRRANRNVSAGRTVA